MRRRAPALKVPPKPRKRPPEEKHLCMCGCELQVTRKVEANHQKGKGAPYVRFGRLNSAPDPPPSDLHSSRAAESSRDVASTSSSPLSRPSGPLGSYQREGAPLPPPISPPPEAIEYGTGFHADDDAAHSSDTPPNDRALSPVGNYNDLPPLQPFGVRRGLHDEDFDQSEFEFNNDDFCDDEGEVSGEGNSDEDHEAGHDHEGSGDEDGQGAQAFGEERIPPLWQSHQPPAEDELDEFWELDVANASTFQ